MTQKAPKNSWASLEQASGPGVLYPLWQSCWAQRGRWVMKGKRPPDPACFSTAVLPYPSLLFPAFPYHSLSFSTSPYPSLVDSAMGFITSNKGLCSFTCPVSGTCFKSSWELSMERTYGFSCNYICEGVHLYVFLCVWKPVVNFRCWSLGTLYLASLR